MKDQETTTHTGEYNEQISRIHMLEKLQEKINENKSFQNIIEKSNS